MWLRVVATVANGRSRLRGGASSKGDAPPSVSSAPRSTTPRKISNLIDLASADTAKSPFRIFYRVVLQCALTMIRSSGEHSERIDSSTRSATANELAPRNILRHWRIATVLSKEKGETNIVEVVINDLSLFHCSVTHMQCFPKHGGSRTTSATSLSTILNPTTSVLSFS